MTKSNPIYWSVINQMSARLQGVEPSILSGVEFRKTRQVWGSAISLVVVTTVGIVGGLVQWRESIEQAQISAALSLVRSAELAFHPEGEPGDAIRHAIDALAVRDMPETRRLLSNILGNTPTQKRNGMATLEFWPSPHIAFGWDEGERNVFLLQDGVVKKLSDDRFETFGTLPRVRDQTFLGIGDHTGLAAYVIGNELSIFDLAKLQKKFSLQLEEIPVTVQFDRLGRFVALQFSTRILVHDLMLDR